MSKFLIHSSCTPSTWKQYEGVFRKFELHCEATSQDKDKPSVKCVINFLASLHEQGGSYATLNTARSALSTKLGLIDGQLIGQHPEVCRLLKGASRVRPPRARYDTTWDTSQVINFVRKHDNQTISLRQMSKKLAALLALCTGQRVQTLGSVKVDNILHYEDRSVLNISDRLKTSKPGIGLTIDLPVYTDKSICVVNCLKTYLEKTANLRHDDYLFIQTKAPYNRASTQTISNWLKEVLTESGVDTQKFSAHSYRHASTSKAKTLGVSIDTIFRAAGWSKSSKVFAQFYNRPIPISENFAESILANQVHS